MNSIAITNSGMRTVNVELPVSEYNFLKTLAKKMGWVTKPVYDDSLVPNEVTEAAIMAAKDDIAEIKDGKKGVEPMDLSSVEAMLSSCGL